MKKANLCFLITMMFLLCGCSAYEIDRGYLVTTIGIEKSENETKIYIEAVSSSDAFGESLNKIVLTSGGESPEDAYKHLRHQLAKPIYFEQLGAVVFNNGLFDDGIEFVEGLSNVSYGIYVVTTDNIEALFNYKPTDGVLGYEIIGLIKNNNDIKNRLYQIKQSNFYIPSVNCIDDKLVISDNGELK